MSRGEALWIIASLVALKLLVNEYNITSWIAVGICILLIALWSPLASAFRFVKKELTGALVDILSEFEGRKIHLKTYPKFKTAIAVVVILLMLTMVYLAFTVFPVLIVASTR